MGVMEIRVTKPTKAFLVLGFLSVAVAFSSLFFKEVSAKVTDIKIYNFYQAGHAATPYSNFTGSRSIFKFASYKYSVESVKYSGWGIANQYDGKTVSIKYFPLFPSVSISSSGLYFLLAFTFFFLAAGLRAIVTWARGA